MDRFDPIEFVIIPSAKLYVKTFNKRTNNAKNFLSA